MDFDPNKPYELVKAADPTFDPSKPHEIIPPATAAAGSVPPTALQPSDIQPAAVFDPTKPHEVVSAPSPEMQAEAKRWQDPNTGALERAGMLMRGFWNRYWTGDAIKSSMSPGKDQPTLPKVDPTGGPAAQVGKTLYNTAVDLHSGALSSGAVSLMLNPVADLYAAPYFIKEAFHAIPEAYRSFVDPNATAAERTGKAADAVLSTLGAVGTAAGAAKVPSMTPVPPALAQARATAANYWRSGNVRDAMTYTRDVADTQAERAANVTSNDIRGPLSRTFGPNAGKAERALSFVVEAMNDPVRLDEFRSKVESSSAANPKWQQRAIEAIDFAKTHFDKLKPVAEKYSGAMQQQWQAEQAAGMDTPFRAGYVMHAQDIAQPAGFESIGGTSDGTASAFRKMREHDTFADSIAAGVDPKSINAVDLMRSRIAAGQKLVNRNAWVDSLRDMKDPTNKQPIATQPEVVTRPDGTTYQNAPPGYRTEIVGNRPIAVQNGYAGLFDAMTKPSAFAQETFGPILQKVNATGKSINLLFDTFHLGRLAMWDSAIKAAGLKTFKAPIPSYKQGLTLLDRSPAEIQNMGAAGEIPKQWVPTLLNNKATLDLLVNHGMNVGHVADAMHQEWVRAVPGIGDFNKFVFEKFQRGAMSEIGLLEFERQRAMYPELTDEQVARNVAKDVNTRFGNFGRQGWLKSQTGRDVARLGVLAPQWNEGLIRSEFSGAGQAAAAVKDAVMNRRLASGMLARGTATMVLGQFAANQLINYYTRGHPTWQNPEEGIGSKLSAWVPDKVGSSSGFFLHPASIAAEVTHLFSQRLERDPNWQKALESYARSRLSAVARPVAVALTGKDTLLQPVRPGEAGKTIAAAALPTPIASSAVMSGAKQIVTGQPSETFPGQYQKQIMASVGLKTDNAPSPEQRMGRLAKEFNAGRGITPSAEFYPSDFQPLTQALRIGNNKDATSALRDLLAKKTTKQVVDHYKHQVTWPFTGQRAREGEFKASLNQEQQTTYDKALESRKQLAEHAITFLSDYLARKEAEK